MDFYLIFIVILILIFIVILVEIRDINRWLAYKVFQDGRIESILEYTVYWRRSLIISTIILLICLAVKLINFNITNIIMFLVISVFVLYFQFNFFDYHCNKFIYKSFDCSYNPNKSNFVAQTEKLNG